MQLSDVSFDSKLSQLALSEQLVGDYAASDGCKTT
jgi:hypothetical protein